MFNQQIIVMLGINPGALNFNPAPPPEGSLISENGEQLISQDGIILIAE